MRYRRSLVIALLALTLVASAAVGAQPTRGSAQDPAAPIVNCSVAAAALTPDAVDDRMLTAINAYRTELHLQLFAYSPTLQRVAAFKAALLATSGSSVLSHDDPDRSWEQRFLDCGYPTSASFSENFGATDYPGAEAVEQLMQAWKQSPVHDPNLRDTGFSYIGVAYAAASSGMVVWVTTFGSDPS